MEGFWLKNEYRIQRNTEIILWSEAWYDAEKDR